MQLNYVADMLPMFPPPPGTCGDGHGAVSQKEVNSVSCAAEEKNLDFSEWFVDEDITINEVKGYENVS